MSSSASNSQTPNIRTYKKKKTVKIKGKSNHNVKAKPSVYYTTGRPTRKSENKSKHSISPIYIWIINFQPYSKKIRHK
jgi:hypothetical protein